MGKAVLIVDMPDTCVDCRFCIELDEGVNACCEVMTDPKNDKLCRMIDCGFGYCQDIPFWCPLNELPERRYYGREYFNGDVKGWNDCLKVITGENNNDKR